MRFNLLLKQSLRDFKAKLMLYTAFFLFSFVIIALILGLFSFNSAFQKNIQTVFENSLRQNAGTRLFNFTSKDAQADDYQKADHYVVDQNDQLKNFAYELLSDKYLGTNPQPSKVVVNGKTYYLPVFKDGDLTRLSGLPNSPTWFLNVFGTRRGYFSSQDLQQVGLDLGINPSTLLTNPNDSDEFKLKSPADAEVNGQELNLLAIYKLHLLINAPSLHPQFFGYVYGHNFLNRYYNEHVVVSDLPYYQGLQPDNFGPDLHSSAFRPFSVVWTAYLPTTDWMRQYNNTFTNQFAEGPLNHVEIDQQLTPAQIGTTYLENLNYGYLAPSFLRYNNLHLGDVITLQINNQPVKIKIAGTAVSQRGFFNNITHSYLYLPSPFLINQLAWGGPNNLDVYFPQAHDNLYEGANLLNQTIYQGLDTQNLLGNIQYNVTPPLSGWEYIYTHIKPLKLLYNLLAYCIGLIALLLLFVVFFFIASEGIKLQKQTLWFLKALGEKTRILTLMTTINIMVPFTLAAVLAIFGSIAVNNIMRSAIYSSFAFSIPWWNFTLASFAAWLVIYLLSFGAFILINYWLLEGKALSLGGGQRVGWITKLYMRTKKIYNPLPSTTRIGIAFVVQNIFKNIITFILLLLSFAVVLFSMEFNSAARNAAQSYEKLNSPAASLMLNKLTNSDNVTWNQRFFNDLKPVGPKLQLATNGMNEVMNSDFAYSAGYQTIGEDEIQNLTAIRQPEEFKQLISQQWNVLQDNFLTLLKQYQGVDKVQDLTKISFWTPIFNSPEKNAFDMSDHFLDRQLIKEIMTKDSALEWANKMVGMSEQEKTATKQFIEAYSDQLAQIIDQLFGVEIPASLIKAQAGQITSAINQANIENFADIINQVRNAGGEIQASLPGFDYGINLFFNKAVVQKNNRQAPSVYANKFYYHGSEISGLGLDYRLAPIYNQLLLENKNLLNDNSAYQIYNPDKLYTYEEIDSNKQPVKVKVRVINVNVSGHFADNWKLSRGKIIKLSANSLALSNQRFPTLYARIDNVIQPSTAFDEIYFDKLSLMAYLSDSIREGTNQNGYDDSMGLEADTAKKPTNEQLLKNLNSPEYRYLNGQAIYLDAKDGFYKDALRKLDGTFEEHDVKPELRPGLIEHLKTDPYYLNNSVYSTSLVPYSLTNLTLSAKTNLGYSFADYLSLPFLVYSSDAYPPNYQNSIYLFASITNSLLNNINPIIITINRFIIILLTVTAIVALILITLIVLENRQTILLFKAMGYRKQEVNRYLTIGYIIAVVFALIMGSILSYVILRTISRTIIASLGLSVYFVWSWQFIVTGLLMTFIFISMVGGTVTIYTNRLHPRDAFASL